MPISFPNVELRVFLEHWDDCNTQINIGEGETHTSVSRFVTSIVATDDLLIASSKTEIDDRGEVGDD